MDNEKCLLFAEAMIQGKSSENKGTAYRYQGMAYRYKGNLDLALNRFQSALNWAKENSDTSELIKSHVVVGELQVVIGSPEEAISNIDQALSLANTINDEHLSTLRSIPKELHWHKLGAIGWL